MKYKTDSFHIFLQTISRYASKKATPELTPLYIHFLVEEFIKMSGKTILKKRQVTVKKEDEFEFDTWSLSATEPSLHSVDSFEFSDDDLSHDFDDQF